MVLLGIKTSVLIVINNNIVHHHHHHHHQYHLQVKSNHNNIKFHILLYPQTSLSAKSHVVLRCNKKSDLIQSRRRKMGGKEMMLTSGASGRVTALLSIQVLKSLLILVNAFFLLLILPFRGRKRGYSEKQEVVSEKNNNDGNGNRKGVRVPATIVPWKSSAMAAVAADAEVALRRAIAIKKVTDGGGVSRREYSLFVTPRGDTMFTQSWTPISVTTRALVVLLHGLNEHRYDEFAKQLNAHGYKVYGMDWVGVEILWMPIGTKAPLVKLSYVSHAHEQLALVDQGVSEIRHGGSDGLHAYVHSLDDAVTDAKAFIQHVMAENTTGLPCFCFGHSTGGAIILKAALDPKVEKSIAGVVLTSPAVGVQPSHPIFLVLAPIFSLLLPRFQLSAANKKGVVVSRDPAALVAKYSDPLVYTGSIRVRTGHEILKITSYLQHNTHKLKVPFFLLHGSADTVTDPGASLKLYEEASSQDKSIKLLPGCLHDLLFEPEQQEIKRDIIEWLNSRV